MRSEEQELVRAISAERFRPFVTECGGDTTVALRLYAWDAEVSRALHSTLRDLEICYRNAVHRQLAGKYRRDDWWNDQRIRLHQAGRGNIADARQELRKRGKAETPGNIMARLTFGFWVGLFAKGEGRHYEMQLWNASLQYLFRAHGVRRDALHRELKALLELRNRVAHHERVFHLPVEARFAAALMLLGYVSPETAALHEKFGQVPQVLARRERVLSGEEEIRL
ncbi:Abi family protein [Actinacidiphila sp. bgisy145]|uniref:Abi family protein n=1 Tax=Actinacidiphila sp. bgisy145 TaxID=3413792 RepID=UPI003EBBAB9C